MICSDRVFYVEFLYGWIGRVLIEIWVGIYGKLFGV